MRDDTILFDVFRGNSNSSSGLQIAVRSSFSLTLKIFSQHLK